MPLAVCPTGPDTGKPGPYDRKEPAVGIRWPILLAAGILAIALAAEDASAQEAGAEDPQPPSHLQIDLSVILGEAREAVRAGDLPRAIELYQVILRFLPESRTARVELSLALAALGERERAARLLRNMDTDGLAPEIIDVVNSLIGPDRLNFFFAPEFFIDTNVSGQTKDEIIYINGLPFRLSEDARGDHGYGYGLTFGASYRILDERPRTTVTSGVTIRDFEGSFDDEQILFGSLSSQVPLGERFTLTPSLTAFYRYDDWQPREFEAGFGLAATAVFGPLRNTFGGRYGLVNGQADDGGSRLDRDIYEAFNTASFGARSVAFRLDERVTYEEWHNLPDQSRIEVDTGLDVTFADLPWAIPTVGTSFTYRDFRDPAPVFNTERLDREIEGHIELLIRNLEVFGSNPFIRYQYTDQNSNIALFDFERHEVSFGIRALVF